MTTFEHIKEGDAVTRMLAGIIPMQMRVTAVDEKLIYCGVVIHENKEHTVDGDPWMFDRVTGAEEDPDLGWGAEQGITGSYLVADDPRQDAAEKPQVESRTSVIGKKASRVFRRR
jgi:hypothetical protein